MSLIQANLQGVEKYAKKLNVGQLYPLFACMLTARSWDSVKTGIDKKSVTESEVRYLLLNSYYLPILR